MLRVKLSCSVLVAVLHCSLCQDLDLLSEHTPVHRPPTTFRQLCGSLIISTPEHFNTHANSPATIDQSCSRQRPLYHTLKARESRTWQTAAEQVQVLEQERAAHAGASARAATAADEVDAADAGDPDAAARRTTRRSGSR